METEDKLIKKFNEATINFLRDKIKKYDAKDFFRLENIIENELLEEYLIDDKAEIIIKKDNKVIDDLERGKLKLIKKENKYDNEIADTRDLFFESKIFDFNGYIPNYIYYKDEKNSEFVIEIECAGIKDDNIKIKGKARKGKVFFHIKGKKKFPEEFDLEAQSFSFYFFINTEKEYIKIDINDKINDTKPSYENGIYRKAFPMKKIKRRKKNEELCCCIN